MYQYNPTNEDEVELKVGDIVHVLEKCDDGWYIGTCERTGVFGTFPGNYVNLVSWFSEITNEAFFNAMQD